MTEESDAKHFSLMSVMWLIVFSQDYNISCKSPLLVVFFLHLFMVILQSYSFWNNKTTAININVVFFVFSTGINWKYKVHVNISCCFFEIICAIIKLFF